MRDEQLLDELEYKIEELEEQLDEDKYCVGCEYIVVESDTLEYWGAPCQREYTVCPGDFSPCDPGCPRWGEYDELYGELKALREQYTTLLDEHEKTGNA